MRRKLFISQYRRLLDFSSWTLCLLPPLSTCMSVWRVSPVRRHTNIQAFWSPKRDFIALSQSSLWGRGRAHPRDTIQPQFLDLWLACVNSNVLMFVLKKNGKLMGLGKKQNIFIEWKLHAQCNGLYFETKNHSSNHLYNETHSARKMCVHI